MAAEDYFDEYDPFDEFYGFDRDEYAGDITHYPIFGVAKETAKAVLFIANQACTQGFWVPKSIIIDKVSPSSIRRGVTFGGSKLNNIKPGRVYVPAFHKQKVISILHVDSKRTSASDDFSEFAPQSTKVNQMENHAQRVKTNHMLSMFQEGYTTIAVEFYGDDTSKMPMPAGGQKKPKLYTYKVMQDLNLKESDLVIVPVGEADEFGILEMRLAIVRVIHATPEIDYDSQIIYRWVIQKLDMTAYNEILENEKKFRDLMVQADKIQHREKLKQAFIELAGDSEAKGLLEQAIKLVAGNKNNVLDA